MIKRVIYCLVVFSVIFAMPVFAQSNTSDSLQGVDKAYQCLEDQIAGKSSLSLQEAVFGTLALGSEGKLKKVIDDEKRANEECWPKESCNVKDTAQVLLSYERTGKNTDKMRDWLKNKSHNANDLSWYLEVDITNHGAAECNLRYDSKEYKINVKDDMTLSGNPGSCFSIDYGGYWLKINDRCFSQDFEISCANGGDFVTALVYQKKSGGSFFVSSETHSGVDGGSTNEKVESKCFGLNSCDYEDSLWASLALSVKKEEIGAYLPYLLALSENNQKYLPSSFLYILTNGEEQYSELIQKQKLGQYWDVVGSPYNRFYDTSLALLGIVGTNAAEVESTRSYLLNAQTKEGCWNNNNIRDTAFVLYSSWPKNVNDDGGGGGGGGPIVTASCEQSGSYCVGLSECSSSGGNILNDLSCPSFRDTCCSVPFIEPSCLSKGGIQCSASQTCTGRLASSADGSCCIGGACPERPTENLCNIKGGNCQVGCVSSEESIDVSCPNTREVCCVAKTTPEPVNEGLSPWIIALIVLIALVLLAILFRHRIQMWIYKRRGDKRAQRMGRPGVPPGGYGGRFGPPMMQRPRYGPPPRYSPSRGSTSEDKEMEETMRKLKEMSK